MSTSPSWFDQDKFSRLVKKVGAGSKTGVARPAPTLPASSPSAPTSTGPAQFPPASEAEAPPAGETPSRSPTIAIPKPTANLPLFTFKATPPAEAASPAATTTPEPAAKAPEPETPEPIPEPTPAPRVFLTPPPDETSAPEPEVREEEKPEATFEPPKDEPEAKEDGQPKASFDFPKAEPEAPEAEKPGFSFDAPEAEPEIIGIKKPKFSFEIPASELPPKPSPPALPAKKVETAAELHVTEQPHAVRKAPPSTTSTLQRLPRIMPGGSKPPAPPTQTRSVSALARRTSTLPGIRPMTEPLQAVERTEAPIRVSDVAPPAATPPPLEFAPKAPTTNLPALARQTKSLPPPLSHHAATSDTWEESIPEPGDIASYQERITQITGERDDLASKVGELSTACQERDEALLEAVTLREQIANAGTAAGQQNVAAAQSLEAALVTGERDAARRDYAELREQYEKLKQDQLRFKNEYATTIAGLQKQVEAAGQETAARGSSSDRDDVLETLKQELKSLHEQADQAKEEASTAQRGLALSQKALQETRDALREASDSKSMLENIKKERTTLVQQNMLLQAQNDQVARELSVLKGKVGSK